MAVSLQMTFSCIFLKGNLCILNQISPKFVIEGLIDNKSAFNLFIG